MIDPTFRDALLKQNGEKPVEVQLTVLDDLVNADRRYVRRLTIWTSAVWAIWVSLIAVGLGLPMVLSATAPRVVGPPQESAAATTPVPAQGQSNPGRAMPVVMAIFAVVVLTATFCLPIAGVILLVMMIAARRTATMSQILASLLAISAELKLIPRQTTPSTGP